MLTPKLDPFMVFSAIAVFPCASAVIHHVFRPLPPPDSLARGDHDSFTCRFPATGTFNTCVCWRETTRSRFSALSPTSELAAPNIAWNLDRENSASSLHRALGSQSLQSAHIYVARRRECHWTNGMAIYVPATREKH